MVDLLRVDIRRLAKGRTLLVLPLVGMGIIFIVYVLQSLISDPEMLRTMEAQGAEVTAQDYANAATANQTTMLEFLFNALFNSSPYLMLLGFGSGLFAVAEFTSGYARNTFSICRNRWGYMAARAVAMLLLAAVVTACMLGFTLLLRPFTIYDAAGDTLRDWAQLFVTETAVAWAFSMLMQFWAALCRSSGAVVAVVVVLGGGLLQLPVNIWCNMLGGFNPFPYTIYGAGQLCSPHYSTGAFNHILLVSAAWVVIYTLLTALVLEHHDIA